MGLYYSTPPVMIEDNKIKEHDDTEEYDGPKNEDDNIFECASCNQQFEIDEGYIIHGRDNISGPHILCTECKNELYDRICYTDSGFFNCPHGKCEKRKNLMSEIILYPSKDKSLNKNGNN